MFISGPRLPAVQEKERQRAKKAKTEQKHKLSFDDFLEENEDEGQAEAATQRQQCAQVGGMVPSLRCRTNGACSCAASGRLCIGRATSPFCCAPAAT